MEEVVFELLLGALAFGDVAIHNDQLRDFTVEIADCAGQRLDHTPAPVFVLDAIFETLAHSALARFARRLKHAHAVVRMDLLKRRRLAQLGRRVTEHSLVGRAVVQASSFHIDERNHVGGVFGNCLEDLVLPSKIAVRAVESQFLSHHENGRRSQSNPGPWRHR